MGFMLKCWSGSLARDYNYISNNGELWYKGGNCVLKFNTTFELCIELGL